MPFSVICGTPCIYSQLGRHGRCMVDTWYGTGWCTWLMHGMVQGWCTWLIVDVHGLVMILVSMWEDLVIVVWWWYINDIVIVIGWCDRVTMIGWCARGIVIGLCDRLDGWWIIGYRLMWQWKVGWCISESGSYRLISGNDILSLHLYFRVAGRDKERGL